MKSHKHNRRHPHPRPPAPREVLAAARTKWKGTTLRPIAWLAGVGLVLLLGFFVLQKHGHPIGAASPLAGGANSADDLNNQPARFLQAGGSSPALAGGTNRPGAALNREAEGRVADLNNQGTRLLEAGGVKRAIPLFQQALTLAPVNETLHYNLGLAFTVADDLPSAEQEYKEALRLLSDFPEAHANYGNLLFRLGRLGEAEEQLTEAVKQMPDSAELHNKLGVLRQWRQETNEALLCFQKAIECDSNYWQAHFNLARASLDRKNRERGIAELRETLRINPEFDGAQRELARYGAGVLKPAPARGDPELASKATAKP
jgi:tetratricopeptide (TPR) repeat protein